MDEDPEKLAEIKAKLRAGNYEIDPIAVAGAVLRRLSELAGARAQRLRSIADAVPERPTQS